MMIIAPNSRAHKGEKQRGKEKEDEGDEFEGRTRGMLTTGEWCNPVSNMLHHV